MAFFSLLASLTILACSWSCHADLVAEICAQSQDITPTTCARTLRLDPRSRGADLGTLGQIAIKNAKIAIKDTATVAKAVVDLNNTGAVSVCVSVCNSAIDDLNTIAGTMKNSSKSDKTVLAIHISGVITDVVTCDDTFALDAAGEPAEVEEASRIARGLIVVVLIIAHMLP